MFWIEWDQGILRVGTGADTDVGRFMKYHDPDSINVTHLSISMGWGAVGEWTFVKLTFLFKTK